MTPVAGLRRQPVPSIGQRWGEFHSCGVQTDGAVVCWGSNDDLDGNFLGQATPPQ